MFESLNYPKQLVFCVGQPYSQEQTRWPEGMKYWFQAAYHRIVLFIREPSPFVMDAFEKGQMRFGLYVEDEVMVMLCMCNHPHVFDEPGIAWQSAGYSWHLGAKNEMPWPAELTPKDMGAMASIILVDAATGIVRGIRVLNFSYEFTKVLHSAIHEQIGFLEIDEAEFDEKFQAIQKRFPTPDVLVKQAQAKCLGGIYEGESSL